MIGIKAYLWGALFLVAASAVLAQNPGRSIRRVAKPVPNEFIVMIEPDPMISIADIAGEIEHRSRGRVEYLWDTPLYRAFSIEASPKAIADLLQDDRIRSVEENSIVEYSSVPWGLDRIDERNLADMDGTYSYSCRTGRGVRIYVVDGGVYGTHQEFKRLDGLPGTRVVPGPNFAADNHPSDRPCADFGAQVLDVGHGTAVASIAAGLTYGVAKESTVVPVRTHDCGGRSTTSRVIQALNWIGANHPSGPRGVVNMSFHFKIVGTDAISAYEQSVFASAVRQLYNQHFTIVTSANNFDDDANNYMPSNIDEIITVAASTSQDTRWYRSNWGTRVDLFAPGDNIQSAHHAVYDATQRLWVLSDAATRAAACAKTGYADCLSGTSFAAPHVAGEAARYIQDNPTVAPATVLSYMLANATSPENASGMQGDLRGSPNELLYRSMPGRCRPVYP
jgi:subtilisin family serine protease